MTKRISATALLLATLSVTASAQNGTRSLDTSAARARSAADTAGGRSWFTSLLRKIARRSDDVVADSSGSGSEVSAAAVADSVDATEATASARSFKSKRDSLAWESAKTVASKSDGYRILVDIFEKQLRVIDGNDTLRTAPVATAMNATLEYGGRKWTFETPRGVRTVRSKVKDPKWTPPEWHFAEVASEHHLKLYQLVRGKVVRLKDGTKLLTRGDEVGIIRPGSTEFEAMALDEHIVFDKTLFIPPDGTKHRVVEGELGHYRLDMGDGFLLHGTPYAKSIGAAVTHGCVRLHDEDIEWLYENVPVGTKVFIY